MVSEHFGILLCGSFHSWNDVFSSVKSRVSLATWSSRTPFDVAVDGCLHSLTPSYCCL